jgi:hypothetical protein
VARRAFDIVNAINLILAVLVLFQVPAVTQFFNANYAYGYEGLVQSLLEEGKPILTFGSHSLAGFFFYLLFYVNLQTFIANRGKLNLMFAFGYLALLIPMYSFTSMVFAGVAVIQLVLCFKAHKTAIVGLIAIALFGGDHRRLPAVRFFRCRRKSPSTLTATRTWKSSIWAFHIQNRSWLMGYGTSEHPVGTTVPSHSKSECDIVLRQRFKGVGCSGKNRTWKKVQVETPGARQGR